MAITYIIVIFLAMIISSIAGLGGGLIIKPILDILGYHNAENISFLATCAILSMSIYSSIKQRKHHNISFDKRIFILVSVGALVGGYFGNQIFIALLQVFSEETVEIIQACGIIIVLLSAIVLVNFNKRHFLLKNSLIIFFTGLVLGTISTFLGIGGGPLNTAIFITLFSFGVKPAIVYSLATIVFSQVSKLITILATTNLGDLDLQALIYIIPTSLLGAIVGTIINRHLSVSKIKVIYNITLFCVIISLLFNIIQEVL